MLANGQFKMIVLPMLFWTTIAATLEKDRRDYWALTDSYRRSEGHYKDLFNFSRQAVFIVSLDGTILYTNSGAKRLNRLQRKTPLLKNTKIQSLFQEENQAKLTEMLASAQHGESDSREFIIKKLPTGTLFPEELQGLGLEIRSQPFPWKDQNSVLITCEDVSVFIVRRLFLAAIYKNLHEQAAEFTEQLESLRSMSSPVDVTALCSYQSLCIDYGNALALQYFMLGRTEMRREGFHIRSELEAIMEFAYCSACKNNIDLLLTREDGFPSTVYGAKLQHEKLLANILSFAVSQASAGSEVSLLCSVEVQARQSAALNEIWLGYRLTFRATELRKEDLDLILITRKQEVKRRTLQDAISLYNRFGLCGVAIDTLLLMLHGYVTSVIQNMLEHNFTIKFQYCFYREFPSHSTLQRCGAAL
jgi:PAS domain S-box-containing protein